jgi:outer membrane protein assembly factor BamB
MSWKSRRDVVVLATLLLGAFGLQMAVAQKGRIRPPIDVVDPSQPPPKPRSDASEFYGFDLPTEEALKDRLKEIGVFIKVEDWAKAVDRLQDLLDRTDDLFAPVDSADSSKNAVRRMVNVRAEASRVVGTLPPKGLDYYRVTYGPVAAEALKTAKATGDAKQLASIMSRYLYTDAGAEATELLATALLDRGNYSAAAICFQRLFQRSSPKDLSPMTLFKATLAFQRAGGDNKFNLDLAWTNLESKTNELTIGNKKVALVDLKAYVAGRKSISSGRERYDWPMQFGDAARSAQGDGTTAFLSERWKYPTVNDSTVAGWIKRVTDYLDGTKQPHLHNFSPIAATLTRIDDGTRVSLMIYRDFWGIRARTVKDIKKDDLKAGDIYWENASSWSMEKMLKEPKAVGMLTQWLQNYIPNNVRPQILLENTVIGSLTTDNVRVYAIEDFQVTPYNPGQRFGQPGGGGPAGALGDAMHHNRLQAYDLDSGKLVWEAGVAGGKGDLNDSFFLGPPLPLNGKLYALNEKDQELRLVTLDPATGNVLVKPQRLADMREKITTEINRRFNADHLAYGEGFLVCPTNAGGILAVDLLTSNQVWAYGYRDKPEQVAQPGMGQPGFPGGGGIAIGPGGMMPPGTIQLTKDITWRATPPVITEGKVVFTAPDATAVHCVNLRDGSRLWKNARKEGDLYFAGVFAGKALVVGRNYARAINIADGAELWAVETGMPSGIGIASKDLYYLPLAQSVKTREPGIALVDMNNGRLHALTRSRPKVDPKDPKKINFEIPGNLLFYEGEVLSQSLTEVAAYPQLDVEMKRVSDLLAANSKDPEGLVRRGDLYLDDGKLGKAVEDLRNALSYMDSKTPADLRNKAKEKLFESLTEFMQRDFNSAEKFLKEYEDLCKVDDPGLPAEERRIRQAEEKRRKGNFYCLLGRGKENQKKLVEAFEAYMNFGTLGAIENEMMSVVDDPGVKASPMVWAQGRIVNMVANASKEEREPLEKLVADRWSKVQNSTDANTLRGFVNTFGSITAIGREARLQLAERLIADAGQDSMMDAERHLGILRVQKDDVTMAARAVEAMARLMTRKSLMEDAAYFYRVLGRDYGKVVVKDGKTGQELYNDLATDKRFLPYLDEPTVAFSGKVKVEETGVSNGYQVNLFQLEQEGEKLPFFQTIYRAAIRSDFGQFKLMYRDPETKEKDLEGYYSQALSGTFFANLFPYNYQNPSAQPRPTFQTLGHLIVVQVGHKVFALDPINKKQLWEKSLTTSTVNAGFKAQPAVDPRDGSTTIVYATPDGWIQRLGRSGPLSPIAACLLTTEGLIGVDPVTGQELWRRNDVSKNSHLYNDEQYIYTVEVALDGTPGTARVFRLHDGVTVPTRDFSDVYRTRVKMHGRTIVSGDSDGRGATLRVYDILTGKDLWKGTFAPGSKIMTPETDDLAGVVEPSGKAVVIDLNTLKTLTLKFTPDAEEKGKEVQPLEGIRPEHLQKAASVHLLRDHRDIYVVCSDPLDPTVVMQNTMQANLMPGMGLRALQVNGAIYSFDGQTGETNWYNSVQNQMLVLDEFEKVPVVLMTARFRKWTNQLMGQANFITTVRSYDKRTGKLLWDKSEDNQAGRYVQFHAIKVDVRGGKVELINSSLTWTHSLIAGPVGSAPAGGGGTGDGGKRTAAPRKGEVPLEEVTIPGVPPQVLPRLIKD